MAAQDWATLDFQRFNGNEYNFNTLDYTFLQNPLGIPHSDPKYVGGSNFPTEKLTFNGAKNLLDLAQGENYQYNLEGAYISFTHYKSSKQMFVATTFSGNYHSAVINYDDNGYEKGLYAILWINPSTHDAVFVMMRYSGYVSGYYWYDQEYVRSNNNEAFFNNLIKNSKRDTNPYADGGYSTGTTTGTGTFDDTSESVPLPTTYTLSATAAGIMSQYVLTEANLAAFGSWLWNGGTIVDDLKHFFQSPMEAIFSVGILPFTPSDTTPYNVYVGALAATGVQGGLVGDTVEKISCGSIDFDGYYGGALDYNPYTKIELFLPYCGTLTLNADEVMGHTISVDYYCDTITGDCVAFVSDEERVLHQVRGNCFIQIPLAARDFTALYSSAIAAIGTIAAGLATAASGGLSAPVAVGMGTSMAANAMNAKTHIARAGGVSGMAGFMSIQKPYVIMTIPNQCLPEFQNDFQGYPLFVTKRLGDFSGYTKVYEIHLDGLDCTDAEAKEIYELLKGGVIL